MKTLYNNFRFHWTLSWIFICFMSACASVPSKYDPPLTTVSNVELNRYLGKWYEIARYPHSFQEGCFGSTAEYSMNQDGSIRVVNRCMKGHPVKGEPIEAIGTAVVDDPATNAKLKVTFFWPFEGDYWIIDLGKNYEYAVVSAPARQHLWILSRTPNMSGEDLDRIKKSLVQAGFDLTPLMETQSRPTL